MGNKKIFIIVGLLILVLLIIGGIVVLSTRKSVRNKVSSPVLQEEVIPKLSAQDIGLALTEEADKKRVIMRISKTSDISSVDYELSYTAKGNIPRGVIGHLDVKVKGKAIKQEIVLGTCSDVCHYDKDVANIKLVLKVTKTNGKVYQVEKTLK